MMTRCIVILLLFINAYSNDHNNINKCEEKNQDLLNRLERLERIFNITQFNPDLDNVSILELLFVNLQDKISRIIPDTDDICEFNWVTGKCNPKCICSFKPKLGDYSPSRSCRLIKKEEIDPNCDQNINDQPWIIKTSNAIQVVLKKFGDVIKEKSPQSDNDCSFSWKQFKCIPEHMCTMKYKFGDYNLNRACRLRFNIDIDEEDNNPIRSIDHINDKITSKESEVEEDDSETEEDILETETSIDTVVNSNEEDEEEEDNDDEIETEDTNNQAQYS